MYMVNASPNARGPNANYIPLARIVSTRLGVGSARLGVGSARRGVGSTKLGIGLLDTNMLVSPTRNCCVVGLNQRDSLTRVVSGRSAI